MLSYKDKTFCGFYESCKDGEDCHRKLDDDVIIGSAETGLPIAQFIEKPECYFFNKNKIDYKSLVGKKSDMEQNYRVIKCQK